MHGSSILHVAMLVIDTKGKIAQVLRMVHLELIWVYIAWILKVSLLLILSMVEVL
jgi:hypothetical protein